MASLNLGSQQQTCPSVFRPVEKRPTAQNRGAPTVSNADSNPTPLSTEEIFVQLGFPREEASEQTESICRLKVKSVIEYTTSPDRLQGPYTQPMSLFNRLLKQLLFDVFRKIRWKGAVPYTIPYASMNRTQARVQVSLIGQPY